MADYRTRDLPLAAYLTQQGHVSSLDPLDGSVWFAFPDPDGSVREAKERFFSGACVPAKTYAATLKACKSRVWFATRDER